MRHGICDVCFAMDLHLPDKNEQDNIFLKAPYQIPYRCLVPVNREGLLMAGRCISGTYETNGSYRATGDCWQRGQRRRSGCVSCEKTAFL